MYSPTFSRLFVYLSVFLLLSSSVSAKPTRFTRDSGTTSRSKDPAVSVAHPKNTGDALNDVVDAKIASARANTKKVASQPRDAAADTKNVAVVDAPQPKKIVVVSTPDPKDAPKDSVAMANALTNTAVNEARLRDAAANLATPTVFTTSANTGSGAKAASANVDPLNGVNADAGPARLQSAVANRNTPNVNVATQNTAGDNDSARSNTGAAANAFLLNVDANDVTNAINSAGSNRIPALVTAGPNQVPGLNLVTAGSGPGVTVSTGGATSSKSADITPGNFITASSSADGTPLSLGNTANRLTSSTNILGVFSGAPNGPLVDTRLTPGANAGSSSATTSIELDPTVQRNTVTSAILQTSGHGIAVGGGPSPGTTNNGGALSVNANAAAGFANVLPESSNVIGTTATPGKVGLSVMGSSG